MFSGYERAIVLAKEKLSLLDAEEVCLRTGVRYENGKYLIPWLGELRDINSGSIQEQILWLHYLTSDGGKKPSGELIPFREIPSALFYNGVFTKRAVRPIIKRFGSNPNDLVKAGKVLGGTEQKLGDGAITINLLPYIPATYIVWAGDEEMAAEGSILYDDCVKGWMNVEDLVVIASLGAYKLVKAL